MPTITIVIFDYLYYIIVLNSVPYILARTVDIVIKIGASFPIHFPIQSLYIIVSVCCLLAFFWLTI